MSKKPKFYAVYKGFQTGIFSTWAECELQVKGFSGSRYKGCYQRAEAEAFVRYGPEGAPSGPAPVQAIPPSPLPQTAGPSQSKPAPSSSKAVGKRPASEMKEESDEEWDVVYTDGACSGNGKSGSMAGIGVWYGVNDGRNISERCPGDQTNNRAELYAIARVLETFPYKRDRPLKILTDSKYSIQCFRDWIPGWRKRGWRKANGEAVLNVGLIKYIDALLDFRSRIGHKVRLEHVRGHSGIPGNEGADVLAVAGYSHPILRELDWEELERGVRARIATIQERMAKQKQAKVEVAESETRTKFQRVSSSGEKRSSGQHQLLETQTQVIKPSGTPQIPQTPTRKAVNPAEVNVSDFEGCFVDDEEQLLQEINSPDPPRTACKVTPVKLSSAEVEAYASGLLDDDDLAAELSAAGFSEELGVDLIVL